jgi:hypothetical protein
LRNSQREKKYCYNNKPGRRCRYSWRIISDFKISDFKISDF